MTTQAQRTELLGEDSGLWNTCSFRFYAMSYILPARLNWLFCFPSLCFSNRLAGRGVMGFFASTAANVLYGIHGASGDKKGNRAINRAGWLFLYRFASIFTGFYGKG
jgi:hypothetical protein